MDNKYIKGYLDVALLAHRIWIIENIYAYERKSMKQQHQPQPSGAVLKR